MGAGCYGVAVIRGIWDAPDPVEAVAEYISALGQQGVKV
jgi:thiamine monophosphate synthase